ncbi:MAG: hypothetical protein ACM34F_15645 [Betaproteobacteria bacterium]
MMQASAVATFLRWKLITNPQKRVTDGTGLTALRRASITVHAAPFQEQSNFREPSRRAPTVLQISQCRVAQVRGGAHADGMNDAPAVDAVP